MKLTSGVLNLVRYLPPLALALRENFNNKRVSYFAYAYERDCRQILSPDPALVKHQSRWHANDFVAAVVAQPNASSGMSVVRWNADGTGINCLASRAERRTGSGLVNQIPGVRHVVATCKTTILTAFVALEAVAPISRVIGGIRRSIANGPRSGMRRGGRVQRRP
jgi:hypothetical protein